MIYSQNEMGGIYIITKLTTRLSKVYIWPEESNALPTT